MIWRSTSLGHAQKHCLALLHPAHDELRKRRLRMYGPGTCAHDIHDRVQRATNKAQKQLSLLAIEELARNAIERAAEDGRIFEGEIEPPLRPDAYLEGKELALRWLEFHPCEPGRDSEIAITIDAWGIQVSKDSPKAWMRGILDLDYVDDDGVAIPADLKTDWPSTEVALLTPQRRIQAMLSFARHSHDGISGLRPEVWNLRRLVKYPREEDRDQYTLTAESLALLDAWREDLLALTRGYTKALEKAKTPEEIATPGHGCMAGEAGECPALAICKAGQWWREQHRIDGTEMVTQLARVNGEGNRLRAKLEPMARETGALVSGNTECGFETKETMRPIIDAALELWREWRGELDPSEPPERALNRERDLLVTFLRAHRLTSKSGFENIQKKLWPIKGSVEERRPIKQTRALQTARLMRPEQYPQWYIKKTRAAEQAEADAKLIETLERSVELTKKRGA